MREKPEILQWLKDNGAPLEDIDPKERLMLELLLDIREELRKW